MTEQNDQTKKPYWLYILKLEHGKYYVGITAHRDPQVRINQHKSGYYSAKWIKAHPYIETLDIIDIGIITKDDAETLEQKHTMEYIEKYGLQSTRGGRLNYHGKYVKIGDRYFTGEETYTMITVLSITACLILVYIVK